MSETATEKLTIKEKRGKLIDMSAEVFTMVKNGMYRSTNEAVLNFFYKKNGHNEFHTFWQWIDKGYRVKKGATAFYVWAKPLGAHKPDEEATPEDEEGRKYFPLCFLFSNLQVDPIKQK